MYPINVQVIKLNPFKKAFEGRLMLTKQGEEVTVTRFTVSVEGDIVELDDTPARFINTSIYDVPQPGDYKW